MVGARGFAARDQVTLGSSIGRSPWQCRRHRYRAPSLRPRGLHQHSASGSTRRTFFTPRTGSRCACCRPTFLRVWLFQRTRPRRSRSTLQHGWPRPTVPWLFSILEWCRAFTSATVSRSRSGPTTSPSRIARSHQPTTLVRSRGFTPVCGNTFQLSIRILPDRRRAQDLDPDIHGIRALDSPRARHSARTDGASAD